MLSCNTAEQRTAENFDERNGLNLYSMRTFSSNDEMHEMHDEVACHPQTLIGLVQEVDGILSVPYI